ncbi:MAG: hypothetical protein ACYDAD_09240 [Acidimicrobiales bacterium]
MSRGLPFGLHQAVEYGLGGFLVFQGAHFGDRAASAAVVGGLVLVVLAALSEGPLCVVRAVPRPLHRALDVGAVALIAAGPFLARVSDQVAAVAVAESVALLLAVVAGSTRYSGRPRRGSASDDPALVPPRAAASNPPVPAPVDQAAKVAGFLAGRASARGPRTVGRLAGHVLARRRRPR